MTEVFERYGVETVHEISSPNGNYRAVLSPQGASLKTLHFEGHEIVSVPLPVTDFAFVGSTLAPWANRLEDATWSLESKQFVGDITESGNHNGLHGLLVRQDFEVVSLADGEITYRWQFASDPVYPFSVTLDVTYELLDAGLTVSYLATNMQSTRVPISLGAHPYFAVDETSQLKTQANSAAVNNERQLPIGKRGVGNIGLTCCDWSPVTKLGLDDCVFDFEGAPETYLSRPSLGLEVKVWQSETMPYQMLFVRGPRFAGANPITVAIEPQTSPANALATKDGAIWLEPNVPFATSWGVTIN